MYCKRFRGNPDVDIQIIFRIVCLYNSHALLITSCVVTKLNLLNRKLFKCMHRSRKYPNFFGLI